MGMNRENHGMTQAESDIALLLAEATDRVEIGTAPLQAVLRGGRRRRARRWAVAAVAVAVLGGAAGGSLAFAGLPGEHGHRRADVAGTPTSPEDRHVYEPQETELSTGTYQGKPWSVTVEVWGAPRNADEAARQFDLMVEEGRHLTVKLPSELIGRTSFFVLRWAEGRQQMMAGSWTKPDRMRATDLESGAAPLGATGADRLVVGQVARTAREVTCTWKDGRTTLVRSGPVQYHHNVPDPAIVPVAGYPAANWFVCVAPEGTSYLTAEVTK
ncbi:hypothetical protein [Streptomyces sp. NPDC093970]|uniref:hypothetical protein n=1 Tax=Streptomyces sp. NPDC093970 TaxID=3155076 RepID=UPI003434EE16